MEQFIQLLSSLIKKLDYPVSDESGIDLRDIFRLARNKGYLSEGDLIKFENMIFNGIK